jgi:hypothetical protein
MTNTWTFVGRSGALAGGGAKAKGRALLPGLYRFTPLE